jgi:N-acetylglucosamine kinase
MSNVHRHFGGGDETPLPSSPARKRLGHRPANAGRPPRPAGPRLAALVLALDPHAIVLGGGLSQLAHLYEKLPAAMSRHLFCGVRTCRYCRRFGDAGGARGAALLARQQLND